MNAIWKFEIKGSFCDIEMPADALILNLATQYEKPCIWAQVETEAPLEKRRFVTLGTGHPFTNHEQARFVGTFMLHGGSFVGHVFEVQP